MALRRGCTLLLPFLLSLNSGCATTVYRMDGEFSTAAGRAKSACETKDWLVIAPTRAEVVPEGKKVSVSRDDGVGLYHVGSDSPESLTALSGVLAPHGGADILDRKVEETKPYDQKRIISASLGVAGVVALTIGTVLMVQSFQTVKRGNEEEQETNKGKLTAGGVVDLVGLGLGIAGIAVNPTQEQRTRANATRYVFTPDDLPREDVQKIVGGYNESIRERCEPPSDADDS